MGVRAEARAATSARILAAARRQIAAQGGGGLSMRAVAREAGLVSSAIYRYYATREALLTAMIVESYGNLDRVLAGASVARTPAAQWVALAGTVRGWAREHPHEFQLIYGTPIPGYVAPPETVPLAGAVASHFLEVGAVREVGGFADPDLARQMKVLTGGHRTASGAAAVLAELAALVGFVGLELSGHFVGTADPAGGLFEAMVARQVATLGLES